MTAPPVHERRDGPAPAPDRATTAPGAEGGVPGRPAAQPRPPGAVLGLAATVLTAVVLSLVALAGVLEGAGWVPGALLAALAVVAATATARVLLPPVLAPLFGAGALVLVLTVLFLREPALAGFVPVPGSLALAEELWQEAARVVVQRPAPYSDERGLRFGAALGAGLVALFVDTVLVGLRQPAASALGVLAVLVAPALVLPTSVGAAGTAAAVLAVLVLLAGGRRWGAARDARTAAAPGSWPRALVVGAGVLAVTLVLPQLVPGFVTGAFPEGSGLTGERAAGVGPLRAVGQDLRSAEQPVRLEYTTSTGEPVLLRTLTLSDFTEDEWFPSTQALEPDLGGLGPTPLNPVGEGPERTTTVELGAGAGQWLPLPWAPVELTGLAEEQWAWSPRDLTVHGERVPPEGTGYEVRSVAVRPTAEQLREAPADPGDPRLAPWLALPEDTPDVLVEAAREQAGDEPTAFDQALALQEWFRSDEFRYDVSTPLAEDYDAGGMASLDEFLATRTGYAGHFAAAMAVMARELGIPSRVAVGYLTSAGTVRDEPFSTPEEADAAFEVYPRDAHAWPELWFEGFGWVRFEPTPGTGEVPGYATETPAEDDGAEPGDDASPGPTEEPTPGRTPENPEEGSATPSAEPDTAPDDDVPPVLEEDTGPVAWPAWLGAGLALLVLLTAVPRIVRERRRRHRMRLLADERLPAAERAMAAWAETGDLAADHGLGRRPAETPRTFVHRLGTAVPSAAPALHRLGRDVERALYAPVTAWSPESGTDDVEALRTGLAAQGGSGAWRARWWPASVVGRR